MDAAALRRWSNEISSQSSSFTSMWSLGSLGCVGLAAGAGFAWFGHAEAVAFALGAGGGCIGSALLFGASSIRAASKLQHELACTSVSFLCFSNYSRQ